MARSLLISLKYLQSPQRYASLDTRLLFTGHASWSPHFHFSDICAACLFGKHVTPVRGMLVANGPSPTAFIIFLRRFPLLLASLVFPSVALAAVTTVSVKEQMCEEKRACVCSSMWIFWQSAEATGLLSGLLSRNGDRHTVFIYPSPQLSLLCLEWVRWTQGYGTLGELSNPLTLPTMQNVTAQNTPWILIMENKSWEGHSRNVQPLSDSSTFIFLFTVKSEQQ